MASLLPLYDEKSLKDYQKIGNLFNEFGIIQVDSNKIANFYTDWKPINGRDTVQLSSAKLYTIDRDEMRKAADYDSFADCRNASPDILPLRAFGIERRGNYYRVYCLENFLGTALASNYYELVIETTKHTFESEIFTPCLYLNSKKSNIVCDSVSIADIDYGEYPQLQMQFTNNGENAGSVTISVIWITTPNYYFDDLVFPLIVFFDESVEVPDSQTLEIAAGATETATFNLTQLLRVGTYIVQHTANVAGCALSSEFQVLADWFSIVSSAWGSASTAHGLQPVTFSFEVANSELIDKLCQIAFTLNGLEASYTSFEETIPAGGSYTFQKTFLIDRVRDNTVVVSGDLSDSKTLAATAATT